MGDWANKITIEPVKSLKQDQHPHATGATRRTLQTLLQTKVGIKVIMQDGDSDLIGASGEEYLGTVNANTVHVSTNKPWTVEFKVDTGADVTVMSESVYHPNKDVKLEPASIPLNGPMGETLEVHGWFTAHLSRKGIESQQELYVVWILSRALLGKPLLSWVVCGQGMVVMSKCSGKVL